MGTLYRPRRVPASSRREINGIDHHFTHWRGRHTASPPLILLHGFLDCGATFQFVADELSPIRNLVAPDWRGFGASAWDPHGYWFPDYLADLEGILDALSPDAPADIVGHSMGGNLALLYAGLRPERVRRLVNLEGFGLMDAAPQLAPGRYREWLDQLRRPESVSQFTSLDLFARVLCKRNPRLTPERADFVARAWSEPLPDGRVQPRFDPAHKRVNPVLYRRAEAEACWAGVRAPVLYVAGAESEFMSRLQGAGDPESMQGFVPQLEPRTVAAAGHMLHHDQPAAVAQLIEAFLST